MRLPFACLLAVGLRSPAVAALLGGYGFFILRGADETYGDGVLAPLAAAIPAAALLVASLGLLVPRLPALLRTGSGVDPR